MAYAETTTVAFEKSIAEIIDLLRKAGAEDIGQMESRAAFTLQFTLSGRLVRFRVQFPNAEAVRRMAGPRQDATKVGEQWRRQRGRALLLVIKAKLESVESKVETFEEAFLANVVMSDGATVYERIGGPIALEYKAGTPTQMLLAGPSDGWGGR